MRKRHHLFFWAQSHFKDIRMIMNQNNPSKFFSRKYLRYVKHQMRPCASSITNRVKFNLIRLLLKDQHLWIFWPWVIFFDLTYLNDFFSFLIPVLFFSQEIIPALIKSKRQLLEEMTKLKMHKSLEIWNVYYPHKNVFISYTLYITKTLKATADTEDKNIWTSRSI